MTVRLFRSTAIAAGFVLFVAIGSLRAADPDDAVTTSPSESETPTPAPAPEPAAEQVDPIDRFVGELATWNTYPAEARTAAAERAKTFAADEYTRPMAIPAALAILEPEFETALVAALDAPASAAESLAPWRSHANPYFAVHAELGTARALLLDERYEAALPFLTAVVDAPAYLCPQQTEAVYLAGVAHARLLDVEKAKPLLKKYLTASIGGSERMRIGAERLLTELDAFEAGSLEDVFYRMDDSRRRLRLADAGDGTVEQQVTIAGLLDQLIAKAEDSECKSGQCDKPGEPKDGNKPGSGKEGQAGGGADDRTPGEVVIKTYTGPESPWSRVRDRDRDPAYSAIKEKFPARYGGLLEQYYKSFQDETP